MVITGDKCLDKFLNKRLREKMGFSGQDDDVTCLLQSERFFSNQSSTYVKMDGNKQFSIAYGLGFASGYLGKDTVRVSCLNVIKWSLLTIYNQLKDFWKYAFEFAPNFI